MTGPGPGPGLGAAPRSTVALVAPDPRWAARFRRTRDDLAVVLPTATIEHIGSTSIPSLSSKDTIDVAVGVDDVVAALSARTLDALRRAGFDHVPASFAEDPDHGFLHRLVDGHRTDHVHVMRLGSAAWRSHLLFRDHLRAHPATARDYERAKQELAERFADDRDQYVVRKQAVVRRLLADAGLGPEGA